MKSGKLNNMEKYCIQGMIQNDMTVTEIASELDRTEKIVKNYLNSIEISLEKVEKNKIKPKLTAKQHMINKTAGKGTKSVSIMTPAASERGDQHHQNHPRIASETIKRAIHTIE